jgi:branched-chain amino acid aminotransferase
MPTLQITRTESSRLTEELREKSPFGTTFADHMLVATCRDGRWQEPEILPYGDLPMAPAASVLHYGQAIFEGFKAHRTADGRAALFRPLDNFARMNRSAARLAMPPIPQRIFMDGLLELLRLDRDWVPVGEGGALYVRPVYLATEALLQVRPASTYQFIIITSPSGPYFSGAVDLLAEPEFARACPGGTGNVKAAGNYAGSLLAAQEAQKQGCHTVLWLDSTTHRLVEECGLMNIAFVMDGRVATPPLSGTILPGITRDSVLAICRDLGITVEERRISIDELFKRHEEGKPTQAAGIGTAATIAPIRKIRFQGKEIEMSPIDPASPLDRARRQLEAIRTGNAPDTHNWLVYVT